MLLSALFGALLGLLIPRLTIPKGERTFDDRFACAVTGAAIALSIWASTVVYAMWRSDRFLERPKGRSRYLVLPALGIVHFAIVYAVCEVLTAWINAAS